MKFGNLAYGSLAACPLCQYLYIRIQLIKLVANLSERYGQATGMKYREFASQFRCRRRLAAATSYYG
ncbi:hypothetical protein ES708_13586 [subsurface metagenome]